MTENSTNKISAICAADERRSDVDDRIRSVLSAHEDAGAKIAGFAFVVWGNDASSTCDWLNLDASPLRMLGIPDYVRDALAVDQSSVGLHPDD